MRMSIGGVDSRRERASRAGAIAGYAIVKDQLLDGAIVAPAERRRHWLEITVVRRLPKDSAIYQFEKLGFGIDARHGGQDGVLVFLERRPELRWR